ncbi:MAG: hypothetical protein HQL56_18675, partial [Magnetococcales bacterium]|nr:hypothetical protein [Magnetococcales bacterium]
FFHVSTEILPCKAGRTIYVSTEILPCKAGRTIYEHHAGIYEHHAGTIAERRKRILALPVVSVVDGPSYSVPPIAETLAKVTDPVLARIMARIHEQHFCKAA